MKTIVTLDMQLYIKAVQITDTFPELKNKFILRIGELHELFAQCRCIGKYIECSGLETLFTHSDIFGSGVVSKILQGKHMKRCVNAALILYCCIFDLFMEKYLAKEPEKSSELIETINQTMNLVKLSNDSNILNEVHNKFSADLKRLNFFRNFKEFRDGLVKQGKYLNNL